MTEGGIQVLMVEDDEDDFILSRNLLRDGGPVQFIVSRADSLQTALQFLSTSEIDVLLLDITLPDCRGAETFQRILSQAPHVPIILLTAVDDEALGMHAVQGGAQDYLVKGRFDGSQLRRSIHYAIERHRAEEALKRYRDNLEILVDARNAELIESNRQLQHEIQVRLEIEQELRDTNRKLSDALIDLKRTQQRIIETERVNALGQMTSGVLHDFNNALMPILGFSDLLLNRPDLLDSREETLTMLTDIRTAAHAAAAELRRLRNFYQPCEEHAQTAVDLPELVEQAVALTRPKWGEEMKAKGIDIQIIRRLDAVPTVIGDPVQIEEIVTNLLLNAIDAMPCGGKITIATKTEGNQATITVQDTGRGMSPEVRVRCMEPFFSTKGAHGTGIGLSVVSGIVRGHGGQVEIASEEGAGTTVTIHFPIRRPPIRLAGGRKRSLHVRILAVDDDIETLALLSRGFKTVNWEVECCSSGREGLAEFDRGGFDLVITDRAMGDMSGDAVAAEIKEKDPSMPVVMLTGFGDLMNISGEHPAGVDVVVSKPIEIQELTRIVSELLGPTNEADGSPVTAPETQR